MKHIRSVSKKPALAQSFIQAKSDFLFNVIETGGTIVINWKYGLL